jgi:hypothetical protein
VAKRIALVQVGIKIRLSVNIPQRNLSLVNQVGPAVLNSRSRAKLFLHLKTTCKGGFLFLDESVIKIVSKN